MRFYKQQHRFYCGIDLHARTHARLHPRSRGRRRPDRNLPCDSTSLLDAIAPFRDGIVIGVECMFAWYWLADLCAEQRSPSCSATPCT